MPSGMTTAKITIAQLHQPKELIHVMINIAKTIAELRVLVGYLGEKPQAGWWSSEFYSPSAAAFLSPIFNRSLFLAQYQGATAAAAKAHDDTIGIGRIFHLFRLPIGYATDGQATTHHFQFHRSTCDLSRQLNF